MALTQVTGDGLNVGAISSVNSEGGGTTTSVVQGLAKAWINLNGTDTIATRDSLNISGATDSGTGVYSASFSASMGSINYTAVGAAGGNNDYFAFSGSGTGGARGDYMITSASSIPIVSSRISDNVEVDNATIFTQIDGDLA